MNENERRTTARRARELPDAYARSSTLRMPACKERVLFLVDGWNSHHMLPQYPAKGRANIPRPGCSTVSQNLFPCAVQ